METLIKKAQQGDKAAEEKLIVDNSGLVWSVVKRFANRGCDREDLYQLGVMGLLKAIKRFDTSYNVCFSTYAVPLIIGEIKRFLRDDGIIKISRGLKEQAAKVLHAREVFEQKNDRTPTVSELAKCLDMQPEQVIQALEVPSRVGSLNEFVGDDNSATLEDLQPCAKNDGETMAEELALKLAIEQLEEKERDIVKLRYFMDKTQTQVAKEMGISQVQVSRLEKKILLKIREKIV